MITIEEAIHFVDRTIQPEILSSVQELVFTQCWQGKTYQDIAQNSGYDSDYIRVVGSRLWLILSECLGEKITKNNFKSILRQQLNQPQINKNAIGYLSALDLPNTPVPLNSSLYIQRPPIEEKAYQEILKPGAFIRINAPMKNGKTSLAMRVLAHAESRNYHTVTLNFQQAENRILGDLNKLLRWFCANITLQLGIESTLNDYWDEDLGIKVSCTTYLQGYVLGQLNSPLAIVLDEVDRLFSQPEIAGEFLPLLRYWHEEANNLILWQKLRFIVIYSTEIYVPLQIHQSPFNIGLALQLTKFSWEQTRELATRYGLYDGENHSDIENLRSLQEIVGGHPYLLNLAFCSSIIKNISLEKLIAEAHTETGIYRNHLRGHLETLLNHPKLAAAYRQVVASEQSVELDSIVACELESLGLIKLQRDRAISTCKLYGLYFRHRL